MKKPRLSVFSITTVSINYTRLSYLMLSAEALQGVLDVGEGSVRMISSFKLKVVT